MEYPEALRPAFPQELRLLPQHQLSGAAVLVQPPVNEISSASLCQIKWIKAGKQLEYRAVTLTVALGWMEISWLGAPCCIWHWPQWPGSAGVLLLVPRGNSVSVLELPHGEGTHLVMVVHSQQQKKSRCLFMGIHLIYL